ncbi:MAG TPA: UDP-N-acetylglucosamine 2-epimerase (non-hydrolyzing) [Thermoanaerobaculia bacterium]
MSSAFRIATVVGARPQFIKAAVLSRLLADIDGIDEFVIHTGQHYDDAMSQVFFDELEMSPPHRNLGVGAGSQGAQTGRMLEGVEQALADLRPDGVLVYGDTNSTLAGALAAAKMHIPLAHVEAGLRSYNRRMPEEINRVLTDHMADLLFAPTAVAVKNLSREGLPADRVHLVGDVMYDAALHYASRAERQSRVIEDLGLTPRGYVLATAHRAENVDDPIRLRAIVEGLSAVAMEIPVVFPVHPRTASALERTGLRRAAEGIRCIEPVGYLDMVRLEKSAAVVATDSGGVQKEAFFYGVPCVTLRDETEWVELLELGWNQLASPLSAAKIRSAVANARGSTGKDSRPYGDGKAGEEILEVIESQWLSERAEPEVRSGRAPGGGAS